jgi:hypothetical protein
MPMERWLMFQLPACHAVSPWATIWVISPSDERML